MSNKMDNNFIHLIFIYKCVKITQKNIDKCMKYTYNISVR